MHLYAYLGGALGYTAELQRPTRPYYGSARGKVGILYSCVTSVWTIAIIIIMKFAPQKYSNIL